VGADDRDRKQAGQTEGTHIGLQTLHRGVAALVEQTGLFPSPWGMEQDPARQLVQTDHMQDPASGQVLRIRDRVHQQQFGP